MRQRFSGSLRYPVIWVALALLPQTVLAIEIRFDYRYDTNGMFNAPERRAALDFAAQTFTVFTDQLAPISTSNGSWNAQFSHPSAATVVNLSGLNVAANEVLIFVGAYDLEGSALARGTVGAFSSVTGDMLLDALQTRGQANATGSAPTDFARWGGTITFDTHRAGETNPRVWHFDPFTPPPSGAMDLVSVALHEIAHVLGFSTSTNSTKPQSFERYLDKVNNLYLGPNAMLEYGGPVPMESSGHHWKSSVKSEFNGNLQTAIMVPTMYTGTRRGFTTLDYAAMADIGWEVPADLLSSPVQLLIGDYNNDTFVNPLDFATWRASYGSTTELAADGNQDSQVNAADYVIWRDAFDPSTLVVGDFDFNQVVDVLDYNVWSGNFGSTGGAADANSNGRVDAADYVLWRDNLGRGAVGIVATVTTVPEPGSIALALVPALLAGCNAARRRYTRATRGAARVVATCFSHASVGGL